MKSPIAKSVATCLYPDGLAWLPADEVAALSLDAIDLWSDELIVPGRWDRAERMRCQSTSARRS
jgi:hypothetical protein